jgi:hypothetical protein
MFLPLVNCEFDSLRNTQIYTKKDQREIISPLACMKVTFQFWFLSVLTPFWVTLGLLRFLAISILTTKAIERSSQLVCFTSLLNTNVIQSPGQIPQQETSAVNLIFLLFPASKQPTPIPARPIFLSCQPCAA